MEEKNLLELKIKSVVKKFLEDIEGEDIQVISHFDTDGITSAAIILKTLKRLDQKFSLKIIKSLDKEFIDKLEKNKITLFVDLASGSLENIKSAQLKKAYIIDHHEIVESIPENVEIINPELFEKQKISSAGLAYLFSKEINERNTDLAKLGILGMIGDQLEKEIDKLNNGILEDGQIKRKRGLLIYPSTRPLNRVLEFSSDPFIPGVTGNIEGVTELLRESNLSPENGKYKSLIDLSEEEMERLVTSILLRNPEKKNKDFIGDLFLIKLFGKLEDAREISAKINACSRDGRSDVAIKFCLENIDAKKKAESIHVKYKQQLISGLRYVEELEIEEEKEYVLINTKNNVKDTMIGTIMSIIANSPKYKEGTALIGMSHNGEGKIKISGRIVGRTGRNIRETLARVMNSFEGEVGGHEFAAGGLINLEDEEKFIELVKENFELPVIRV